MRVYFDGAALIDTSAVISLHDPTEQLHSAVRRCYASDSSFRWFALDLTSHECFTTVRYRSSYEAAIEHYSFLRNNVRCTLIRFEHSDEAYALQIVERHRDVSISFHDALCASAMKRLGIFKVLTIDRDFSIMGAALGFEVLPAGRA